MKTTVEFLDSVKAKHGFTSDYQLAPHLGCTRQAISKYRVGKDYLGEDMACKVAADLGLDSSYVLACIASERAKKPEVKAAWKHAAEVLYGIAAVLAVVAVLPFVTLPYNDAGMVAAMDDVYYVKPAWQAIFLACSAVCLLLYPVIMACLPQQRHTHDREQ